jgi:predicted CXXCH cytochrome family protein
VLYTGGEPGTYLAGGNFYWVKEGLGGDDTKGHNVFLGEPDDNLALAPGDPARSLCGGPDNCHANLNQTVTVGIPAHVGRQGCTKCHMMSDLGPTSGYHHADDSNIVVGSVLDDTDGFYRFLTGHQSGSGLGVSGIEDEDWQATTEVDDHNEYLGFQDTLDSGFVGFGALGHTMTGFCCGCHGNFHVEHPGGGDPSWIRHPSDGVIPDRDEYADAYGAAGGGTGVYDPQVPVARPDLTGWPGPSAAVNLDSDMVMCLSCHRAHGSQYPDMLRWDYDTMTAGGGGSGGCFTCHTEKDNP